MPGPQIDKVIERQRKKGIIKAQLESTDPKDAIGYTNKNPRLLSCESAWDVNLDPAAYNAYPANEQWKERLIYTMVNWAQHENGVEIGEFCSKYHFEIDTLENWAHQHEDIARAYKIMKQEIATRRRVLTIWKKVDGSYAYKDMHWYDPRWHKAQREEELSLLKATETIKKENGPQQAQLLVYEAANGKPNVIPKELAEQGVTCKKDHDAYKERKENNDK